MIHSTRNEKLLKVVLVLTVLTVLATAVIGFLGLPRIFASADSGAALQKVSDQRACRSEYASRVTEAQNVDAADAAARVQRIDSERVDLIGQLLQASLAEDRPAAAKSVTQLVALQADAVSARTDLTDARQLVKDLTSEYRDAVRLSRRDPGRFLEECAKLPG